MWLRGLALGRVSWFAFYIRRLESVECMFELVRFIVVWLRIIVLLLFVCGSKHRLMRGVSALCWACSPLLVAGFSGAGSGSFLVCRGAVLHALSLLGDVPVWVFGAFLFPFCFGWCSRGLFVFVCVCFGFGVFVCMVVFCGLCRCGFLLAGCWSLVLCVAPCVFALGFWVFLGFLLLEQSICFSSVLWGGYGKNVE